MKWIIPLIAAVLAAKAAPVGAVSLSEETFLAMASADVVLLGELHDNPAHHQAQADLVTRLVPTALVFEMLTPDQVALITPDIRDDADALGAALNWEARGWPDFAMYHPIFAAAPGATIYGAAVPREADRASMQDGIVRTFGDQAAAFGLSDPLPAREQELREDLQMKTHCNAMPEHVLPAMVDIQRLRDARLAQETLSALQQTGGPVVVITGNGHARSDWGIPRFLRRVDPQIRVFALGQTEDGQALPGAFDAVLDAPGIVRDDPCAVFARPAE